MLDGEHLPGSPSALVLECTFGCSTCNGTSDYQPRFCLLYSVFLFVDNMDMFAFHYFSPVFYPLPYVVNILVEIPQTHLGPTL